jgi:hypothetical protein
MEMYPDQAASILEEAELKKKMTIARMTTIKSFKEGKSISQMNADEEDADEEGGVAAHNSSMPPMQRALSSRAPAVDRAQSRLQTVDFIADVNSALKNIEAAMRVGTTKSAGAAEPVRGVSFGVPGAVPQNEVNDEAGAVAADLESTRNSMFGAREANADAGAVDFDSDAGSDADKDDDDSQLGEPVSRAASRSVLWSVETAAPKRSPPRGPPRGADAKPSVAPSASSSSAAVAPRSAAGATNRGSSRQPAAAAPIGAKPTNVDRDQDISKQPPSKTAPDRTRDEYDENPTDIPIPEDLVFVPGANPYLLYESSDFRC